MDYINFLRRNLKLKEDKVLWLASRIYYDNDISSLLVHCVNNGIDDDTIAILYGQADTVLQKVMPTVYSEYTNLIISHKHQEHFCEKVKQKLVEIFQIHVSSFHKVEKKEIVNDSVFVRTIILLDKIVKSSKFNNEVLNLFLNKDITKALTGIRFPLLIEDNNGIINGRRRYSIKPFVIKGKEYYVVNEIYQNNYDRLKDFAIKAKLINE